VGLAENSLLMMLHVACSAPPAAALRDDAVSHGYVEGLIGCGRLKVSCNYPMNLVLPAFVVEIAHAEASLCACKVPAPSPAKPTRPGPDGGEMTKDGFGNSHDIISAFS